MVTQFHAVRPRPAASARSGAGSRATPGSLSLPPYLLYTVSICLLWTDSVLGAWNYRPGVGPTAASRYSRTLVQEERPRPPEDKWRDRL